LAFCASGVISQKDYSLSFVLPRGAIRSIEVSVEMAMNHIYKGTLKIAEINGGSTIIDSAIECSANGEL
jgi:hypothetical protein